MVFRDIEGGIFRCVLTLEVYISRGVQMCFELFRGIWGGRGFRYVWKCLHVFRCVCEYYG